MIDLILLAAGPARRFGQEQLLGDAGGAPCTAAPLRRPARRRMP
ncbi:MAG: hypothetical protein ACLT3D_08195 [Lawsonibacter sp.]